MKWTVHDERDGFRTDRLALTLADVELPDGQRIDHVAVRYNRPAAATVVLDHDDQVLMIFRHRFITDTWDWELPAGIVDPGEEPHEAAARETLEETGWEPSRVEQLLQYFPSSGSTDEEFHIFFARGARYCGPPADLNEALRIAWVPLADAARMIKDGEIQNSLTISGLLYLLAYGAPDRGSAMADDTADRT